MRKVMYTVLITGLFLLLLSALVVTPEVPEAVSLGEASTDFQAVFRPLQSVLLPSAADAPRCSPGAQLLAWAMPVYALFCLIPGLTRDANGRVLTAVRYENSVYQLFRPEVAGG